MGVMNSNAQKAVDYLLPNDSTIEGYLYVGAKKYEICSFDTEFEQPEDYKGQPQHEVKGGLLSVTLKQVVDSTISDWMLKKGVTYDGSIVFTSSSRISSPPITILFTEGKCISYQKLTGKEVGISLTILISAKELNINGIDHTNSSKK